MRILLTLKQISMPPGIKLPFLYIFYHIYHKVLDFSPLPDIC